MSTEVNKGLDPSPIIRHMGESIARIHPKPCVSPHGQITASDHDEGDRSSRMSEIEDVIYDAFKLRP